MDAPASDSALADGGDAMTDAPTPYDAGAIACSWSGGPRLTSLVQLAALNTDFNEMEPFVAYNGLRLFFYSNRSGSGDIYTAARTSTTQTFTGAILQPSFNTADVETRLEFSRDELDVVMAAEWSGSEGGSDLWIAHRADAGGSFPAWTNLSALNSPDEEVDPHLSADGLRLYYSDNLGGAPATHHYRILVSERTTRTEPFGPGRVLDELTEPGWDNANATLSGDETVVVFTSTRPVVTGGASEVSIWYATRTSRSAPFGAPAALPSPINIASTVDYEPFITPDGCQLIFSSMRNADGDADLFLVTFD